MFWNIVKAQALQCLPLNVALDYVIVGKWKLTLKCNVAFNAWLMVFLRTRSDHESTSSSDDSEFE